MNVHYSLTLHLMCSFYDALCLQRPRPPTIWIYHDFNYHINERENPKMCLTKHEDFILRHYIVFNNLGGGHTHASILTSWTKAISRNQSRAGLQLVHALFKKRQLWGFWTQDFLLNSFLCKIIVLSKHTLRN